MNISKELAKLLDSNENKGTKPYDTKATVKRVENGVAWVHIPGGVDETPAQLTINAKPGDSVQVRVADGKAFLVGNGSAPPTDDTTARQAIDYSKIASDAANAAVQDASTARTAAASAQAAADHAEEVAEGVEAIAESAKTAADTAQGAVDEAFRKVSWVEDIVGVLQLVAEHGSYDVTKDAKPMNDKWYFIKEGDAYNLVQSTIDSVYHLTSDAAIDTSKTYYTRTGEGTEESPYIYDEVEQPDVSEIGTYYEKYYELVGIDESIQNYVSSHLVLTQNGLSLKADNNPFLLEISPNGMVIRGENNKALATYGTDTIVGDKSGFHVKIDGTELGFYDGATKVAYINSNRLYITQSVVLQQMDVGARVTEGGLGQWSWKIHDVNGRNNLYLKWLG